MARRGGGFPPGFFDSEEPPIRRVPPQPAFPTIRLSPFLIGWIVLIVLLVLFLFLLQPFATLYTDWLWFRALGYGSVFGTRFRAQLLTFFVFAVVLWAFAGVNAAVALRSGRRLSTIGIRQRITRSPGVVFAGLAVFLLGLIFARIAAGQWQTILTFLNQMPFGTQDPVWHKDVGFYVFTLPFYRFLWGWFLGAVIVVGLGAFALHASRTGLQTFTLTPRIIRHLSILGALFAALLAWNYRLDLYEILLSKHGFVFGAGYADLEARVPAYWIMVGLMVLVTIGLLVNARLALVAPLVFAVVGWLGGQLLLLVIFPGIVQRFQVTPDELHRETPYIANQISYTRQAYGLAGIADTPFSPQAAVTADQVARNPLTVQNARLWDPQQALPQTLQQIQSLRTYYDFDPHDVAVDRYNLNGTYLQLLLEAREISPTQLPQTWIALKLQYTHGYGVVAARANEATDQGLPVLTLKDIPPSGQPAVSQPAIYFGRHTTDYVLVHSHQAEFDYPGEPDRYTHWSGSNGVALSSALRRLALAVRFGDLNILLSSELTPDTQALFQRRVQDRVSALAPFLQFDADPYVVVVDGKLYWIQDAYTVSDHYPYSQASPDPSLFPGQNYVRNSVKAVINAYDGSTTLYQIDQQDPVVRTYAAIFPGLFKAFSEMPAGLQAHIRYPRDLFGIQTEMFTLYHVTDPVVFYARSDVWDIATESLQPGQSPSPIRPFYVIMKLPGDTQEQFFTILPYTPYKKTNMIAYLAARSDLPNYGKMFDFRFPKESLIVGPQQVESNIEQAPAIKSQFSLLNQSGASSLIRGNLLVLPIENSLLYVEPIYLQAENLKIPELKKVIVATGQQVAMEDTLDKALASLLGTAAPTQPGGTGPAPTGTIASLVASANQHYQAALADLQKGDFVGYAQEIKTVGELLRQLQQLTAGTAALPSPSPSR
jgi:uncharacterized membrane protein (UPF0182 family)